MQVFSFAAALQPKLKIFQRLNRKKSTRKKIKVFFCKAFNGKRGKEIKNFLPLVPFKETLQDLPYTAFESRCNTNYYAPGKVVF